MNATLPGFEPAPSTTRAFAKAPAPARQTAADVGARNWLAVASAEHVQRGRAEGFMQVCHGKCAPLRRLRPGDRVVYYSPTRSFGGKDRLQAFTALGVVDAGDPFAFDMGGGFVPFRRRVRWHADAQEQPIAPLLQQLDFSAGVANWGYTLRFGLLTLSQHDMDVIEGTMRQTCAA